MNRESKYITALIDGEPIRVQHGSTVLDAARKAGLHIPTLCYLENLESYGACRLCIVKIKGMKGYPTACTTPLEAGMEITTKTPELQSLRRNILEMTLSEHPYTCLVCADKKECTDFMHTTRKAGTITGCNFCTSNGDCDLQDLIDYLDLKSVRYPIAYRGIAPVRDNPFYDLDYNLCVLCGRCVRICNEERNSHVLAFVQRGNATIVGTAFGESQADAGCEFCGACVDVCPTGSISGKFGKWAGLPDGSVQTTCTLCSVGCTMNVNVRGNRIVEVGPRPGGRMNPPQLCIRGKFLAADITHHPSRITTPLVRKKGKWVEVPWEEAIAFTARKLEKYSGNGFGLLCSEQDTLEDIYSLQKFSRSVMRSGQLDLISGNQEKDLTESITSLLSCSDSRVNIESADTLLLLGTDASLTHPLLENRIRKAFNRGTGILYVNETKTRTSRFTTSEIRIKKGKENLILYLLTAALAKKTDARLPAGFARHAGEPALTRALKSCTTAEEDLESLAGALTRSKRLCLLAGGPFLESNAARETVKALGNILFLKKDTARIRIMLPDFEGSRYGSLLAGILPDKSRDEMLAGIGREGIQAMMISGDMPSDPRLKKLNFLVQLNMFRSGLSDRADVFLPVTGLFENKGHFLNSEGKIKTLRKAIPPAGGSRTIASILAALARAMDQPGLSDKPSEIWKEMKEKIKIPARAAGKLTLKFLSPDPLAGQAASKRPAYPENGVDRYQYRGNSLSGLIPDLQSLKRSTIKQE